MKTAHNLFETLEKFDLGTGQQGSFYSLPQLERAGVGQVSRLPVSIRLVLESVLRNCDGKRVSEQNMSAPWPIGNLRRRAPRRSPSWSPASFCRISRACPCW